MTPMEKALKQGREMRNDFLRMQIEDMSMMSQRAAFERKIFGLKLAILAITVLVPAGLAISVLL